MLRVKSNIVLASGSPRRSEMLTACGIPFVKSVSDCPEDILPGEGSQAMVERLALLKANAVADNHLDSWVLGADTTVEIDGEILGKPVDVPDAARMLALIGGRTHRVWGGFALVNRSMGVVHVESHMTEVTIRDLSESEITRYIETGEPLDKAGSYGIQGVGASIVSEVRGSYTNVVGLNLSAVIAAFSRYGVIS